jgi:hypothetical protein
LKKRTSINSISDFHKEKEMADFRKWLLALAAVAVLLGLGSSTAVAATTFTCQTNAGNPEIVRAEGVAELVGDLTLNCTGGTPTQAGQSIPLSTVQVSMNTNITSRIIDATDNASEALLLIDEPFPTAAIGENPPTSEGGTNNAQGSAGVPNPGGQLGCLAINSVNCAIISVGVGVGAGGSYSGLTPGTGSPLGTGNHYNVFQGVQNSASSIAWQGVPIDAPGTAGTRTIRITNVRANACLLGVSSTFIPTQIVELIGITGSQGLLINNPTQVVAEAEEGLLVTNTSNLYTQCNNLNGNLLGGAVGVASAGATINVTEGFSAAFKERNINQVLAAHGEGPGAGNGTSDPDSDIGLQNIPGFIYNTESGFIPGLIGLTGAGGYEAGGTGIGLVGLASQGTEIEVDLAGIPTGVSLFVPTSITLTGAYGGAVPGNAVLVGSASGQLTVSGTTAVATYEILYADPSVLETMSIPVQESWITTSPTLPGVGTATAQVNFAPLSTSPTAAPNVPIPRFCQPHVPFNLFTINLCTCNLLFPFVSNQAGFDTGIAIANTTADTLNGLVPQSGPFTLTYYGTTTGGGAAPPTYTSTTAVPAGSEITFDLSSGGNYGIPATPGFQGYIIARTDFQYCHGFAFLSPVGDQGAGQGAGYLAIQLDMPGLYRTGQFGENLAH